MITGPRAAGVPANRSCGSPSFGTTEGTRIVLVRGDDPDRPTDRPVRYEADDELGLLVAATWHSQIWQLESAEQNETLGEVAWHLADHLEHWVCECVYRGERPNPVFSVPARRR